MSEEDKKTWKAWEEWDVKRHAYHLAIYKKAQADPKDDASAEPTESEADSSLMSMHVPKKRKSHDKVEAPKIPKKPRTY